MHHDVVIIGGGPAGSSLAIRLAESGLTVSLFEREEFPREKLCGEFISPECFEHFAELGLKEAMLCAGGTAISETIFFARGGKSIMVPSQWLDFADAALGLSRAKMDALLLDRAKEAGARVYTGVAVSSTDMNDGRVFGLRVKHRSGATSNINGELYIDATGRSAVLGKLVSPRASRTSAFVAFKAHLTDVNCDANRCEIYSFDRGYGGLNFVEDGKANFCFILRSQEARKLKASSEGLFESLISQNARATETLRSAKPLHDWLAVAVDQFGTKNLRPAANVFSVGDAGAFIDPFTGSGMLMAFESSRFLARSIIEAFPDVESIANSYRKLHEAEFSDRLGIAGLIRHAAYRPHVASLLISLLSGSKTARRLLARSTRPTPTGTPKKA